MAGGAAALALGAWLTQTYLLPGVMRWWRGGPPEPSPADKAAAAVAQAIQAQVGLVACRMTCKPAAFSNCLRPGHQCAHGVQTVEMRSTMEGMKAMLAAAEAAKAAQPEVLSLPDLREELRGLVSALAE